MTFRKVILLKKGFTLIEMIVVLALISILTVLVLFNSAKLNSATLVGNTAYEIGLMIRESQIAGLGVQAVNSGGSTTYSTSHGVHFDVNNPTKVILFGDANQNLAFDNLEATQEYNFQNKRVGTILAICAKQTNSQGYCTNTNDTFIHAVTADIVFTRPNPEAFFKIRTVAGAAPVEHFGAIIINVGFENDVCRSVVIEKTGAVQIDNSYCPPAI